MSYSIPTLPAMQVNVYTAAGHIICKMDNAGNKTPKDLIVDINERYGDYRRLFMSLITPWGVSIKKYNEHFSDIFSGREHQYVVNLTIYTSDIRVFDVENIERIIDNIGDFLYSNAPEKFEKTMCEIMKNVSSLQEYIVPPCSSTLEQFNMISELSVWSKFAYYESTLEVESIINLIKNFIVTQKIVTCMVNKMIDKAFYLPVFIEIMK